MNRPLAADALTAALALLLTSAEAAVIHVNVTGVAFAPVEIAAKVGDTIEWDNADFVAHTATARDKSFDLMLRAKGGSGSLVVKAAGAIDYYCRFHPMMKGRIVVE